MKTTCSLAPTHNPSVKGTSCGKPPLTSNVGHLPGEPTFAEECEDSWLPNRRLCKRQIRLRHVAMCADPVAVRGHASSRVHSR